MPERVHLRSKSSAPSAFVTGGTGFLGRHLVEQLHDAGWHVTALHRSASNVAPLEALGVTLAQGDVTDAASVESGVPPGVDVVFHAAGDTSLWARDRARQWQVNVEGTRNVLAACRARGAGRLIHTSSIAAWGAARGVIDEDTPQRGDASPVAYERSKHAAEVLVRRAVDRGLDAVVLHPCAVIGPYDTTHWGRSFQLARRGLLRAVSDGRVVFNHAREVARAHLRAAEIAEPGTRFVLGGDDASMAEIVCAMQGLLGRTPRVATVPHWLLRIVARVLGPVGRVTGRQPMLTPEMVTIMSRTMRASSALAERVLGYRAVPLETCLRDGHDWLVQSGHFDGSSLGSRSGGLVA